MKKLTHAVLLSSTLVLATGCMSTGQQLAMNKVSSIQKNVTTESQVRALFGEPVSYNIDTNRGVKVLEYGYNENDQAKRALATTAGAAAGAALGSNVGNGNGSAVMSMVGYMGGAFLGSNAVTARSRNQKLTVTISLDTNRVIDYNYTESGKRSQKMGFVSGVSAF